MMKKILFLIIAVLLLPVIVLAEPEYMIVNLEVNKEMNFKLNNVEFTDFTLLRPAMYGEYALVSLDSNKRMLSSVPFNVEFGQHIHTLGQVEISYDKVNLEIAAPFSGDTNSISIIKANDTLFERSIKEFFCIPNSICESFENYNSCQRDCPSGSEDGYCDNIEDGICDPDCALVDKKDCGREVIKEKQKPATTTQPKNPFLLWLIITSILAIILAIVIFFIWKRRQHQRELLQ